MRKLLCKYLQNSSVISSYIFQESLCPLWFIFTEIFMTILKMGTRGSALALAQARQTARALEGCHGNLRVEEIIIRTTGDKQQGQPLPEIGGKGVFTLEIEQALLNGEIDFAVHSLKDLPPLFPKNLCLACVPMRENPADTCILRRDLKSVESENLWPQLPIGARVGTSSLRRAAQLKAQRSDLQIDSVRGNIDTRLRKLDESFDAILLARSGLERLGVDLSAHWHFDFNCDAFVPAPGQGALALEARCDDENVLQVLAALENPNSRFCVEAERACMEALQAGCSTPLGAYAQIEGETCTLHAVVLAHDGSQKLSAEVCGELKNGAQIIGQTAARQLLEDGAGELMNA